MTSDFEDFLKKLQTEQTLWRISCDMRYLETLHRGLDLTPLAEALEKVKLIVGKWK